MKTISLKIPEALDARVAALARQTGTGKSDVVRNALEAYLARDRGRERGSVFDLCADLGGCVSGPKDLSVNTKYLRRYGK